MATLALIEGIQKGAGENMVKLVGETTQKPLATVLEEIILESNRQDARLESLETP
jgi:hypothetical protein